MQRNPSLCSTLEPLYYNSYAMVVGGIRFINFVDFGMPYRTRITSLFPYLVLCVMHLWAKDFRVLTAGRRTPIQHSVLFKNSG